MHIEAKQKRPLEERYCRIVTDIATTKNYHLPGLDLLLEWYCGDFFLL